MKTNNKLRSTKENTIEIPHSSSIWLQIDRNRWKGSQIKFSIVLKILFYLQNF